MKNLNNGITRSLHYELAEYSSVSLISIYCNLLAHQYMPSITNTIGKLQRVPLREIWRNEAQNFTTWLAENIDTLSEEIGFPLSIIAREKAVGDFSLDLVAEDSDGQIVIIENQLEKTNHDHLGKLLTYLSNLDAKTAIWVTSMPREEHIKAINWLNECTPEDVSFYLVKIEAVKIGGSEPAPMFTIVAEPTEIAKSVGKEKKEYAERHHLRKEF